MDTGGCDKWMKGKAKKKRDKVVSQLAPFWDQKICRSTEGPASRIIKRLRTSSPIVKKPGSLRSKKASRRIYNSHITFWNTNTKSKSDVRFVAIQTLAHLKVRLLICNFTAMGRLPPDFLSRVSSLHSNRIQELPKWHKMRVHLSQVSSSIPDSLMRSEPEDAEVLGHLDHLMNQQEKIRYILRPSIHQ